MMRVWIALSQCSPQTKRVCVAECSLVIRSACNPACDSPRGSATVASSNIVVTQPILHSPERTDSGGQLHASGFAHIDAMPQKRYPASRRKARKLHAAQQDATSATKSYRYAFRYFRTQENVGRSIMAVFTSFLELHCRGFLFLRFSGSFPTLVSPVFFKNVVSLFFFLVLFVSLSGSFHTEVSVCVHRHFRTASRITRRCASMLSARIIAAMLEWFQQLILMCSLLRVHDQVILSPIQWLRHQCFCFQN